MRKFTLTSRCGLVDEEWARPGQHPIGLLNPDIVVVASGDVPGIHEFELRLALVWLCRIDRLTVFDNDDLCHIVGPDHFHFDWLGSLQRNLSSNEVPAHPYLHEDVVHGGIRAPL